MKQVIEIEFETMAGRVAGSFANATGLNCASKQEKLANSLITCFIIILDKKNMMKQIAKIKRLLDSLKKILDTHLASTSLHLEEGLQFILHRHKITQYGVQSFLCGKLLELGGQLKRLSIAEGGCDSSVFLLSLRPCV